MANCEMTEPISWWRIDFGEAESTAVAKAVADEHVSQGPIVAEFERQLAAYLGVPFVVATTSGSMALLMSLWAAGVGPGDEVIVPNRTWIATAHAAVLLGATVRLVDVEEGRPIIAASKIEQAISSRTKAIVPVHMCGRSADMRSINSIGQKHGIAVIEDAAQALGSRNPDGFVGTQSDMGCFSLSVAKIISTGQGGFVATRSESIYERLVAMRTHGVASVVNAEWKQPGFNFRFTDLLASIGIEQLKRMPEHVEKLGAIYRLYSDGLGGHPSVKLLPVNIEAGEVPVYIEALCEDRDRLISHLAETRIQCRPFYPDLDHAGYLNNSGDFPNSRRYGRSGVYLPSGPGQDITCLNRVIDAISQFRT